MSDREFERRTDVDGLTQTADRLDGLAEMSDMMGDAAGARDLRDAANTARLRAMTLLDDTVD